MAKPFKDSIVARHGINLTCKLEKARSAIKADKQKLIEATRTLQDAATDIVKRKKNAKNVVEGKPLEGIVSKSKRVKTRWQILSKPHANRRAFKQ